MVMPGLDLISLFPVLLGILLLFFGRKTFWLFVGAVAFALVMSVAPRFFPHEQSTIFYVAVAVGALACALGYFIQKVALRVAGFLAGGYLFFSLWEQHAADAEIAWWIPFAVGGVLGALLLSFLFEWALIILSSLTGAYLISQSLNVSESLKLGLLIVLAGFGMLVQVKAKRGKSKRE